MINKIICSINTFGLNCMDEIIPAIAACGFHNVEMSCEQNRPMAIIPERMIYFGHDSSPDAHFAYSIKDLRDFVETKALKIEGLNAGCEMRHSKSVDLLRERSRLAGFLGAKWIVTGLGMHNGTEEDKNVIFDNLKIAANEAAKHRVTVCIKTDGWLVKKTSATLDFLRSAQNENIKLDYDPAHILYYDNKADVNSCLKAIVNHVGCVHLRESTGKAGVREFPPLGRGVIGWKAIFEMLNAEGFYGPFVLDLDNSYLWKPDQSHIPLTHSYWQTKQYDRNGIEKNIGRVKESLEFLGGIIQMRI